MPGTNIHNLPYPAQLAPGAGPDVPADLKSALDAIDPKLSPVSKGLIDDRPPFGKVGQRYIATDEANTVYLDIGTVWVKETPSADAAAGVASLRTLGAGPLQAAAGNDGRLSDARAPLDGSVTAAKIADALKPSTGAAAATEALRALGVAAGTAAAGNDGRLSDARVPLAHAASHQEGGADDIGSVPIGGMIAYAGQALPAGTKWDWADGGLIDKTTFATFFGRVQHAYNGGVDPGSNKVRKPDKRGRVSVGADSMGVGAAGRLPNSNRALGQNGGEERHTLAATEAGVSSHGHGHDFGVWNGGAHGHTASGGAGFMTIEQGGQIQKRAGTPYGTGSGFIGDAVFVPNGAVLADGGTNVTPDHTHVLGGGVINHGGQAATNPHNNLQPYEVDNYIVRVA